MVQNVVYFSASRATYDNLKNLTEKEYITPADYCFILLSTFP